MLCRFSHSLQVAGWQVELHLAVGDEQGRLQGRGQHTSTGRGTIGGHSSWELKRGRGREGGQLKL